LHLTEFEWLFLFLYASFLIRSIIFERFVTEWAGIANSLRHSLNKHESNSTDCLSYYLLLVLILVLSTDQPLFCPGVEKCL